MRRGPKYGFAVVVNVPRLVVTVVPGGNPVGGFVGKLRAALHSDSADAHVMQPLLLHTSIEPSFGFTLQPQRAPLAVLSMHAPTASLPVSAWAFGG